jgi:DNA-binding NarL/FixJ family response regulator
MRINRSRHVRVLIAANHLPSIDKIKELVFPRFEVVGIANGVGEQTLRRAFELKPEIILIEAALAIENDFEAVTAISQWLPKTWIIFFQNEAGSVAAVASPNTRSMPRRAVNSAHQCPAHPASEELTGREYEVLALLAAGHPMKRIAFRLGISYRTVTFHKYKMMERLRTSTNAGLIAYALRNASTNADQRESTAVA